MSMIAGVWDGKEPNIAEGDEAAAGIADQQADAAAAAAANGKGRASPR